MNCKDIFIKLAGVDGKQRRAFSDDLWYNKTNAPDTCLNSLTLVFVIDAFEMISNNL